jgi:hypothetical protein
VLLERRLRPTISVMAMCNAILSGLLLCVSMLAFSLYRYPVFLEATSFLVLALAGVLWYAYAAVRWTHAKSGEDAVILNQGMKWGLAIGSAFVVEVVLANLVTPHKLGARIGVLAAAVAVVLPFIAGAINAVRTGRVRSGMRVGFWSGVISGLMTFVALAAAGYIVALIPGLPGAEMPANGAGTEAELERHNVGEYMAAAINHLVGVGAVFCSVAGAVGGALGILVARAGR